YNWPLQFCLAANKTQKRYLAIHVELWMIRCFLVHEFYLVKDSTSKCDIFALCAVIADIELIIVVDAQDMLLHYRVALQVIETQVANRICSRILLRSLIKYCILLRLH
ncbi:hypothetical protein ACJX0J_006732, partial [Zea mays]